MNASQSSPQCRENNNSNFELTVASARGLREVYIDTLKLQVRVTVEGTSGVYAMLIADNFLQVPKSA